jgi:hypothetical protein
VGWCSFRLPKSGTSCVRNSCIRLRWSFL